MPYLNRDQLIAKLMEHPNVEVGTDEGFVVGVELSSYDDETRNNVPYIHLEIDEES